ncbi:hypothetical protein PBRA_007477 [Plasmodiophora brassicae]|uniref:NIF system FeS cluster assembly NifU N-terminal domain-containing protein n=1 Tax=Plasmodiophora brassicae TaxID=37360 RepID=A0A0G4IWP6_PLABS|nr:hypothetical protein PBRA_007477 [Plasmodiophora brassicae]
MLGRRERRGPDRVARSPRRRVAVPFWNADRVRPRDRSGCSRVMQRLSRRAWVARRAVRAYHKRVIDHYENPRNAGTLDRQDPSVGTGLVGAPACGDVLRLQIKVDKDGVVEDAKFKTFGCGSAIAASSLATEWIRGGARPWYTMIGSTSPIEHEYCGAGKKLDEVLKIRNSDIAKHLSLPPVKLHCSMLAEDAIKSAVQDYRKKRDSTG